MRVLYSIVAPSTAFIAYCDPKMTGLIIAADAWGGEPGILNGNGGKPKWMRWSTFERLAAEHDQFVGRSMHAAALKFGLLGNDFRF